MEKKKALISVDKEAWEGTQKLLKELKISNQIYNEMLNEFIRSQYKVLQGLRQKQVDGEPVTMADFLRMMAGILDEIQDDQMKL